MLVSYRFLRTRWNYSCGRVPLRLAYGRRKRGDSSRGYTRNMRRFMPAICALRVRSIPPPIKELFPEKQRHLDRAGPRVHACGSYLQSFLSSPRIQFVRRRYWASADRRDPNKPPSRIHRCVPHTVHYPPTVQFSAVCGIGISRGKQEEYVWIEES